MSQFPDQIESDEEREVFRTFARIYPLEAADVNFPELLRMAQELNPKITEEALREIIKNCEASDAH